MEPQPARASIDNALTLRITIFSEAETSAFRQVVGKEGKAKQRRENQPDAEGVEAGAEHRPQPDVGPYQIANDQDGQAEHLYTGTALRTKRGRVGSFTQRATDRLAMITALKTGTGSRRTRWWSVRRRPLKSLAIPPPSSSAEYSSATAWRRRVKRCGCERRCENRAARPGG